MLSLRSVSGSNSSRGIAAVVGVGPRLGSAVARKFASEGDTIAILSRDLGTSSHPPLSLFRSAEHKAESLRLARVASQ